MHALQEQMDSYYFNQSKRINSKIQDLEARLDALKKLKQQNFVTRQNIHMVSCFNQELLLKVLSYFVSLVEGKEYLPSIAPLGFSTNINSPKRVNHNAPFMDEYQLVYLAQKDQAEMAQQEINERFSLDFRQVGLAKEKVYAGLTSPSTNYIQLTFYHRDTTSNFHYNDRKYTSLNDYENSIFVCDERFSYIQDFLSYVIDYRLQKQDGYFQITEEEMMN